MLKKLKKCVWQIAIRTRGNNLLFEEDGKEIEFVPIKNSLRYWCADPFLIDYKSKKYLFFELYDRLKRKVIIGYRELKNGKLGKINKAFETYAHLSYPFIFEQDGSLFIVPESNNLSKTMLLKNKPNSDRLEFEQIKIVYDVSPLADATFLIKNGKTYMFATQVTNTDNTGNLNIFQLRDGKWENIFGRATIEDKSIARMGGKFINYNGVTIRPSQDCSATYGGGLNFSEIKRLDESEYKEVLICKLSPGDVKIKGVNDYDGVHTYNYDEDYEVVDFKKNSKFSAIECIGFLLEKLHLVKKVYRK